MRVLVLINDSSVFKLDIEILIDRVKRPSYRQVVLELHRHFPTHQVLEVREEQLHQTQKMKTHKTETTKYGDFGKKTHQEVEKFPKRS